MIGENTDVAADSDNTWLDRCHVLLYEWRVNADEVIESAAVRGDNDGALMENGGV